MKICIYQAECTQNNTEGCIFPFCSITRKTQCFRSQVKQMTNKNRQQRKSGLAYIQIITQTRDIQNFQTPASLITDLPIPFVHNTPSKQKAISIVLHRKVTMHF